MILAHEESETVNNQANKRAHHGPYVPLDITGSFKWFLANPRSLLPGCPQALQSQGGSDCGELDNTSSG